MGKTNWEAEEPSSAYNAEKSTTHNAASEQFLTESDIWVSRVYNLDKTGVTLKKETSRKPFIRTRKSKTEHFRVARMKNMSRITIIATVCADGTCFPSSITIKGGGVPYRVLIWRRDKRFNLSVVSYQRVNWMR